jgi:hypothetical protein
MSTCAYCGRERKRKYMIESRIMRGKVVCKSDVTTCLRLRAGAVFERNER